MSRKGAVARMNKVSRATVYRWLNREDLRPTKVKTRKRKIDSAALQQDGDQYPEARLKDRARSGVQPILPAGRSPRAIDCALENEKVKVAQKKSYGHFN
ncbi:IS630 transposase-related protein [Thermostichus sp. MS-CIW-34]